MAGSGHSHAIGKLEALAVAWAFLGDHTNRFREERDEAVRDALDEGVSVSRIAKALGISRQATDDLVKRVRRA